MGILKKILTLIIILILLIISISIRHNKTYKVKVAAKRIDNYINKIDIPEETKQDEYDYVAVLEIPKINLKKGIVALNNPYNDVKYNIQIINGSDMPNTEKGNFILASHNGNSNVSYFKDLEKLDVDDKVIVYYNGYKYTYIVDNYYEVLKNGIVDIVRDINRRVVTLITCKNNSDNKQIVFVSYLALVEEY